MQLFQLPTVGFYISSEPVIEDGRDSTHKVWGPTTPWCFVQVACCDTSGCLHALELPLVDDPPAAACEGRVHLYLDVCVLQSVHI